MSTYVNSRALFATLVFAGLIGLLAMDLSFSEPLNPYSAPAPIALGSGEASSGAYCALVPPSE